MKKVNLPKLTLYIAGLLLVVLSFSIAYARYPSVTCVARPACSLEEGGELLWDVLSRQLFSASVAE